MAQATANQTPINSAQHKNKPGVPPPLANQPPNAPPAKMPSDCKVLYTPNAEPRPPGGAKREARLGWLASSTLKPQKKKVIRQNVGLC